MRIDECADSSSRLPRGRGAPRSAGNARRLHDQKGRERPGFARAKREKRANYDKNFVKSLDGAFFRRILCRKEDDGLNITELASRSGVAERQVRYMIAEGFVPAPRGSRSQPDYGEDHLDAIRRYTTLRGLGFPPSAIRLLRESGEAVVLPIVDGVSLSLEPRLVGVPLDIPPILDRIGAILKQMQKEPSR